MAVLARHPLIDEILDARREYARGETAAFEGYRNHAHRVYNFARSIASLSPQGEDKVAIAAAIHDLCVIDGLDYLEPSIATCGRPDVSDREVALMIAFHHRVRPYRGEHAGLVEPFRRADWNDFTMGLVKAGVPRDLRKAADAIGWGSPLKPGRGRGIGVAIKSSATTGASAGC